MKVEDQQQQLEAVSPTAEATTALSSSSPSSVDANRPPQSRSDSRASISLPPIQHVLQTIDDYQNQQKLQDSELLLAFRDVRDGPQNVDSVSESKKPRSLSNPTSFDHQSTTNTTEDTATATSNDSPMHLRSSHSTSQIPLHSRQAPSDSSTPIKSEDLAASASGKLLSNSLLQRSLSYGAIGSPLPQFTAPQMKEHSLTDHHTPSRASSIESTDSAPSTGADTPNSNHSNNSNSKKRTNLPRETIEILNDWIVNNLDNPYPNHTQKRMLLEKTGLSNVQLSNWFINKRRRRLFSNLSGNQGYPIKKKRLIDRI